MTILVLGMHRSGTSAVTAVIEAMGAHAGRPQEMLDTSPDNPEGFFERKDVLNANRAIMQHHRSNWYQIEQFDVPVPPLAHALQTHMGHIVGNLKSHAPYVVKDPRFCLTLPYWRPLLKPVVVLALRHPAAIAHSLQLRNQMPIEQGLALWEFYMTRALKNIEGMKVIRCEYEKLLASPDAAHSLHTALKAHIPSLTMPDALPLNPSLAHANSEAPLTSAQQALYQKLLLKN